MDSKIKKRKSQENEEEEEGRREMRLESEDNIKYIMRQLEKRNDSGQGKMTEYFDKKFKPSCIYKKWEKEDKKEEELILYDLIPNDDKADIPNVLLNADGINVILPINVKMKREIFLTSAKGNKERETSWEKSMESMRSSKIKTDESHSM